MRSSIAIANLLALILAVATLGCHSRLFVYEDPKYQVSISYPGNLDLFHDKEALQKELGLSGSRETALDKPEPLFVVATPERAKLSCSLHLLPKEVQLTADKYFELSTAKELARLKVNIVEPKSRVQLGGKTFLRVGFTLRSGDIVVRSRIYQYLDADSGRILVLTLTALAPKWENELKMLQPVLESLEFSWSPEPTTKS